MRVNPVFTAAIRIAVAGVILSWAVVASAAKPKTITLYSPRIGEQRYDEHQSYVNFATATYGTTANWDLSYGTLRVSEDFDWFKPGLIGTRQNAMRDLGVHTWKDRVRVPVVAVNPLPAQGKVRQITVDASAGKYEKWRDENGVYVRALAGHMYAMHVKNARKDFYVLIRVESIVRGESCTISWKKVRAPR